MIFAAKKDKILSDGAGNYYITLVTQDKAVTTLPEYELDIKAVKRCNRRSLAANRYLWVLCGKIAGQLKTTDREVYRSFIREQNVYDDYEAPEKTAKTLVDTWQGLHIGRFAELLDYSGRGNMCLVRAYYGSSEYDARQMSELIECVVTEARSLDIETATPEEQALMIARWKAL